MEAKAAFKSVDDMDCRGQFHQQFYLQLLQAKIPKVQKIPSSISLFCAFGIFTHKI